MSSTTGGKPVRLSTETADESSPAPEAAGVEAVATVQPSGGSLLQSVTTYRPFARVSGQRREE